VLSRRKRSPPPPRRPGVAGRCCLSGPLASPADASPPAFAALKYGRSRARRVAFSNLYNAPCFAPKRRATSSSGRRGGPRQHDRRARGATKKPRKPPSSSFPPSLSNFCCVQQKLRNLRGLVYDDQKGIPVFVEAAGAGPENFLLLRGVELTVLVWLAAEGGWLHRQGSIERGKPLSFGRESP
jgi:hypothetical protein